MTDKQRISKAFLTLRRKGYWCKHKNQCCSTCGWSVVPEDRADKAVFYHLQDAEVLCKGDVEEDKTLFLTWDGEGEEIVRAFQAQGFIVIWDGSNNTRIGIQHNERVDYTHPYLTKKDKICA